MVMTNREAEPGAADARTPQAARGMTPARRRMADELPRRDFDRLAREAAAAGAGGAPLPSPCVGVCRLDATSGQCVGCWRALGEIGAWPGLDDALKWRLWQQLLLRRATGDTPPP